MHKEEINKNSNKINDFLIRNSWLKEFKNHEVSFNDYVLSINHKFKTNIIRYSTNTFFDESILDEFKDKILYSFMSQLGSSVVLTFIFMINQTTFLVLFPVLYEDKLKFLAEIHSDSLGEYIEFIEKYKNFISKDEEKKLGFGGI